MDVVKEVLDTYKKYKPITVDKHLDCHIDVGMMLIKDPNDLDANDMKEDRENYLLNLTRDNTQLLINAIWQLPTERVDECIVAKLPTPTTVLPRLHKVPGPRPLTKWEKFAKEKGITKKKKEKKVYDAVLDKWIPTYGYKRAEAEKQKDWVIEVPKNADPMQDMFQQKADLRSEKVAKNEIQRMKNILRAKKEQIPRGGYLGAEVATPSQLLTAVTVAKSSTASVGKFQSKLPEEKEARGIGVKELIPGAKRKASHIAEQPEKQINMDLVKSVLNKKPKIDIEKAISIQKQEERFEREANNGENNGGKKKSRNSKKAIARRRMSGKKPKGGCGKRAPGKKPSIGRKRR